MAKPEEKIVKIVDEAIHTRGVSIDQLGEWGAMAVFIVAEDVDDPGTYYAVQGQFDDNGNFGLVGAGTGTTPPTGGPSGDAVLLETGDYVLLETGDYLLLE